MQSTLNEDECRVPIPYQNSAPQCSAEGVALQVSSFVTHVVRAAARMLREYLFDQGSGYAACVSLPPLQLIRTALAVLFGHYYLCIDYVYEHRRPLQPTLSILPRHGGKGRRC